MKRALSILLLTIAALTANNNRGCKCGQISLTPWKYCGGVVLDTCTGHIYKRLCPSR